MAFSVANAGKARRRRHRHAPKPMSEINVTPFVDVMLVLLIVFMVTAPLLTAGVPIDLPQAAVQPLAVDKEPILVSVDPDGKVFIGDEEVTMDELVPRLTAIATEGFDERIYVRGDRTASYGTIMTVMGTINNAGFKRIGLVALQESEG
ncbi:MAG TPA: protein TolR [Bauldia sp.]|nr:protein TolR [Bauldia sp.]